MSRGSPICPIRIPSELLAVMEATIRRANAVRRAEPWTRSGFIIAAIREKIAKMERSRSSGGRSSGGRSTTARKRPPGDDVPLPEDDV